MTSNTFEQKKKKRILGEARFSRGDNNFFLFETNRRKRSKSIIWMVLVEGDATHTKKNKLRHLGLLIYLFIFFFFYLWHHSKWRGRESENESEKNYLIFFLLLHRHTHTHTYSYDFLHIEYGEEWRENRSSITINESRRRREINKLSFILKTRWSKMKSNSFDLVSKLDSLCNRWELVKKSLDRLEMMIDIKIGAVFFLFRFLK